MIKPAIGYYAVCRCGRKGSFADNRRRARESAVNTGWLDLYPTRTDFKTILLCKPCATEEEFKRNRNNK